MPDQQTDQVQAQPSQSTEPWNRDWGIPKVEQASNPDQEASQASEPWNRDWGISDYINGAVEAVKDLPGAIHGLGLKAVASKMWAAESSNRHTDSSGNLITSPKGAKGITQVMPATARDPGFGVKPLQNDSKEEYLRFGEDYIGAMLNKYNGDYRMAVAAYNAGPGNVDKAVEQSKKEGGDFTQYLPKPNETLPYMDRILGTENGIASATGSVDISASRGKLSEIKSEPKQADRQFYESLPSTTLRETGGSFRDKGIDPTVASERTMAVAADTPFSEIANVNDGLRGFVYNSNGDRVFLTSGSKDNTMLHEREHLSQQWAQEHQVDPKMKLGTIANYDKPIGQFTRLMSDMREDSAVKEVFSSSNSFDSPQETLANYSAFFQEKGIDPFKSKLFDVLKNKVGEKKAEEYIMAANAYTMMDIPTISRTDFSDKNPVVKEFKGKSDSYALEAYRYLKSVFDGVTNG